MKADANDLTTFIKTIELWWLLRQVSNLIHKALEDELWQLGCVPYVHIMTLYIVKAIEATGIPATPAEISRWVIHEPHTISTRLTHMEKDGLVRKTHDLERKNLVRVSVTDKGEEALRDAMKIRTFTNIISRLSSEDQGCLREHLETMRSNAIDELLKTMPRKRPEEIAVMPRILK